MFCGGDHFRFLIHKKNEITVWDHPMIIHVQFELVNQKLMYWEQIFIHFYILNYVLRTRWWPSWISDQQKNIHFVEYHPRKVPTKCDFKWFSSSQNDNLKYFLNYFSLELFPFDHLYRIYFLCTCIPYCIVLQSLFTFILISHIDIRGG